MNQSHEKVGFVVVEHPYFRKFPKNAQLFNEFLDKGGINILLKWFEKAQEFESINGVLFSLPFCLSAAFAKFYPLPTTKIVEKRHIIECIFKIVDFLRKSIDNPDIAMWIMRDDSLDNMWKKEHIRHVYNLLNSHQQENIIPQVISCTLATSCATHLICGAILSNWIANMTDWFRFCNSSKNCINKRYQQTTTAATVAFSIFDTTLSSSRQLHKHTCCYFNDYC